MDVTYTELRSALNRAFDGVPLTDREREIVSSRQAELTRGYFMCLHDRDYLNLIQTYFRCYDDLEGFLRENLSGRNIIEAGTSYNPALPFLLEHDIVPASYTCVDPNMGEYTRKRLEVLLQGNIPIDISDKDILSHLKDQPDNSSIVISFGVLDLLPEDYVGLLMAEIARTTAPGDITFHISNLPKAMSKILDRPQYERKSYPGNSDILHVLIVK